VSSVALSTRVLLQEGGVLVRLANDARLRKKLFTAEAGVHPAKGHLGLWEAIIERYTAGIAVGVLIARARSK